MKSCRAYPFPDTFEKFETDNWWSKPEKYPCVALHTYHQTYSGRDGFLTEFVYLSDFDYYFCEYCGKLVLGDELEYRYKITEGDNQYYEICSKCQNLSNTFYEES